MNLILAVLEVKGIISHEEAEKLAEYSSHAPQSSRYKDMLEAVKKLTDTDKEEQYLHNI